jgi:hypothetical protein
MRAKVFYAIDGYDEVFFGPEAFDIHQRIKNAGYKIGRIEDSIKHHEVVPFGRMVRKYYLYAQDVPLYVKRNPKSGIPQFFILRPAFLRNWRLFINDPIHGLGLMIIKLSQYAAGGVGFLTWIIRRGHRKQDSISTKRT